VVVGRLRSRRPPAGGLGGDCYAAGNNGLVGICLAHRRWDNRHIYMQRVLLNVESEWRGIEAGFEKKKYNLGLRKRDTLGIRGFDTDRRGNDDKTPQPQRAEPLALQQRTA